MTGLHLLHTNLVRLHAHDTEIVFLAPYTTCFSRRSMKQWILPGPRNWLFFPWPITVNKEGGKRQTVLGRRPATADSKYIAPRAGHTMYRKQGCVVRRGIKTVDRQPNWCRLNSEYHKPYVNSVHIVVSHLWRGMGEHQLCPPFPV